jgi:hypothetical protein
MIGMPKRSAQVTEALIACSAVSKPRGAKDASIALPCAFPQTVQFSPYFSIKTLETPRGSTASS